MGPHGTPFRKPRQLSCTPLPALGASQSALQGVGHNVTVNISENRGSCPKLVHFLDCHIKVFVKKAITLLGHRGPMQNATVVSLYTDQMMLKMSVMECSIWNDLLSDTRRTLCWGVTHCRSPTYVVSSSGKDVMKCRLRWNLHNLEVLPSQSEWTAVPCSCVTSYHEAWKHIVQMVRENSGWENYSINVSHVIDNSARTLNWDSN